MFDTNFYPTPQSVFDMMGVEAYNKTILEPHAGSGNLLDFIKIQGPKEMLCCEKNEKLAEIAKSKAKFLTYDFFDLVPEMISHVDLIIMNPPFDHDAKHVLHAYEIAAPGTEIISLCNASTIENGYTMRERQLKTLIKDHGLFENLGSCFTTAERKTDVEVGLIKLYKPGQKNDDFGSFFTDEEDEAFGSEAGGLMKHNKIRELVQRYVQAVKDFRDYEIVTKKINANLSAIGIRDPFKVEVEYQQTTIGMDGFIKEVQKKAWQHVFRLVNAEKYLTRGVKQDLNKFIEQNTKIPFTMKNIYRMLDVLVQTRDQSYMKSLVEVIDNYTMHTHENRYSVEGWKTNSGYMLNKKFIIHYMINTWSTEKNYVRLETHRDRYERLEDLVKVCCNVSGKDYNEVKSFGFASCKEPYMYSGYNKELSPTPKLTYEMPHDFNQFTPNVWYKHEFFEFKVFKKGTMHLKFRDEKLWEKINRLYAKAKGQVLPDKI